MHRQRVLFLSTLLLILSSTVNGLWNQDSYAPPLEVKSTNFDGSVLIIGGGFAGMFAAYTFEYIGFKNYTILEANSDVGGRVRETTSFIDLPMDLGAEWIIVKPRVLQDILLFNDEVDVRTISYVPRRFRYYWRGILLRANFIKFIYWRWGEFKFRTTTWYSYMKKYVYPYISQSIQLNTIVRTVDYSNPSYVSVITQAGTELRADKVIIATPVTVLQQDDITFVPALPADKQSAIDSVKMGAGLKVYIEFSRRFYPDMVLTDRHYKRFYMDGVFRKPTKRHVLIMYADREPAAEWVVHDDNAIFTKVMAELDKMFRGKATRFYKQHFIQNWSNEPFIKGAYSNNYDIPQDVIKSPIDKRIYFCGEYLNYDHQSTVHGAAISGRTVADRLLLDAAW